MPATGDRVPCVYVEQGRVVNLDPMDPIAVSYMERIDKSPSGAEQRERLKQNWDHGHNQTIVNGISRIGWMTGGQQARWIDEDMADVFTRKAVDFIERHANAPFFLYFATHDIHVPRVPHARFASKSDRGPRGDAVLELDWSVGQVLAALDKHNLSHNTLVIFASDNGPVLNDGYRDEANERLNGHDPNGPYRAGKYSLYEGGSRTPFLVRWPARVKPGQTSGALFGQIDLAASLAKLVGSKIPQGACPDSRDELDALLGDDLVGRPHLVHEAGRLGLRLGQWKYVTPGKTRDSLNPGSPRIVPEPGELYHVANDSEETNNLAAAEPDRLQEMAALLKTIRNTPDGDSRPDEALVLPADSR
jgi:arylsulfatase A-like enzyme